MPGPILGLRPDIEHDDVAARQPLLELRSRKVINTLDQVVVGEDAHLGHMPDGDITYGSPEISDTITRQSVVDPCAGPARSNKACLRQHLQMLRGVGDALRDLDSELIDRTLPLSEHVHDLGPAPTPERTRNRRESIEQCCL